MLEIILQQNNIVDQFIVKSVEIRRLFTLLQKAPLHLLFYTIVVHISTLFIRKLAIFIVRTSEYCLIFLIV